MKKAVDADSTESVKWFADSSGNPKEIEEILVPVLKSDKDKNRWWAAMHLSRHAPDTEGLLEVLLEALKSDWIAMKIDNSSTGLTGKGEAAKALARLDKRAEDAAADLIEQLKKDIIEDNQYTKPILIGFQELIDLFQGD